MVAAVGPSTCNADRRTEPGRDKRQPFSECGRGLGRQKSKPGPTVPVETAQHIVYPQRVGFPAAHIYLYRHLLLLARRPSLGRRFHLLGRRLGARLGRL